MDEKPLSETPFSQYLEERFRFLQERIRELKAQLDSTQEEMRQIVAALHNREGEAQATVKIRQIKESAATEKGLETEQVTGEWTVPILEILNKRKYFMSRNALAREMKIFGYTEDVDSEYLKKLSDALFKMGRRKKINSYQNSGVKGKFYGLPEWFVDNKPSPEFIKQKALVNELGL